MIVEAPRAHDVPAGRRFEARVRWEGPWRGPERVWFDVGGDVAADADARAEAFLVAVAPTAVWVGEPRVVVEAPLCPRLVEGVRDAMRVLSTWWPRCVPVPVEPAGGLDALRPRLPRRAAVFLSGGVDSLSLLRANRLAHPLDHPASFADGVLLFGWHEADVDPTTDAPRPERLSAFEATHARLRAFARAQGLDPLVVRTNARRLHPDHAMSVGVGFGAGMLAAAHLFPRRLTEVGYASSGLGPSAPPHGSHPLLDPCWSSGAVEVLVGEPFTPREAKLARLAAWRDGLEALHVCLLHDLPPDGRANCGRCEKCLRTRLGLAALGVAPLPASLGGGAVTVEQAEAFRPSGPLQAALAQDLAHALARAGRHDLAVVVARKAAAAHRRSRRRGRWWYRAWRRLRGR